MKIVTLNMNGIRSAAKKGCLAWLQETLPDIVCVQETKAQLAVLDAAALAVPGYQLYHVDAKKPGYSGVAVYTRHIPQAVVTQTGHAVMDTEGRFIQLDFRDFSVASLYLPSGTTGEARQAVKYDVMDWVGEWMRGVLRSKRPFWICADWNIAPQAIDLKNWKANQKNSGFLPQEREWMAGLLQSGWVDAFRALCTAPEQYTWWSTRGQAYAKNVGWRLDYPLVTPDWQPRLQHAMIYKEQRFSDHAPVCVTADLDHLQF